MRIPLPPLVAGGLAALTGCGGIIAACTLIGCTDGLSVTVIGTHLPSPYTIEVHLPDGTVEARSCPNAASCGNTLFFDGITPSTALLRFVGGENAVERTVTPTYSTFRPNGRGCPPECRQGHATLQL
jgi:hypothetical protein